jgi:putative DNA methylase
VNTAHPKRLIEVDLPIKRISAHARREKSIRHGHISTLHIWWARRPLASCRAVICAALWPDPADEHCPPDFRAAAAATLVAFAERVRSDAKLAGLCADSWTRWNRTTAASLSADDPACWGDLRYALLDFIADFANWDASTVPAFLETARTLTQAAHESLGGEPGTRPLVVDPFAGGGAIPLEALRVGADAFASDLNPVAVLLNKVVLEYIPKYGQRLADEVRKWGAWVKAEAEKELAEFYPNDPDGATPIAYLWARTVSCEGPGCGAEVPLMRSLWLSKKANRPVALRIVPNSREKRVDFELIHGAKAKDVAEGTVRRGSATCPCCGFTTPVASVRRQLREHHGGADGARLFCVVTTRDDKQGRFYRLPTEQDLDAVRRATEELARREKTHSGALPLVPDESLPPQGTLGFRVQLYGMENWGDLFTRRQALALTTLAGLIKDAGATCEQESGADIAAAVQVGLAFVLDKVLDRANALARWEPNVQCSQQLFGRQAIPIVWDFGELRVVDSAAGSWESLLDVWLGGAVSVSQAYALGERGEAITHLSSATDCPLPDDSARAMITDPPYYDAIPYSDLSDFFYVWLKRTLPNSAHVWFEAQLAPKEDECIVNETRGQDRTHYERTTAASMVEGRRVLSPNGIGVVVFAHKSTSGWETQLQAMVDAGWTITGSWPIDTEMGSRLRAMDSAALASSIHLVCRPREDSAGAVLQNVGDWRDVLDELPKRIKEWLPRLVEEGVVGADAIFACLGPALEIYSRYARVEKASGEQVRLGEYLEQVWAAVSKEALSLLFRGADASGLEPDARLTAMWLWTLSAAKPADEGDDADDTDDEGSVGKKLPAGRYSLEFDAARKIAQGLGAHLDRLGHVVEIRGDTARLLTAAERAAYLFGHADPTTAAPKRPKERLQLDFFAQMAVVEETPDQPLETTERARPGATALDRVHQAMVLFGAGRSEALKRFLVEDGVGRERAFWGLAQSLSALYPSGSEEKRWVDGVLARKKGLGF